MKSLIILSVLWISMATAAKKPYPRFDKNENQLLSFSKLASKSKAEDRKLVLIFGHNKCPSCLYLANSLKKHEDIMPQNVNYLKVNPRIESGKKVLEKLGLKFKGVPHFSVYDPKTNTTFDEKDMQGKSSNSIQYLSNLISASDLLDKDSRTAL